MSASLRTTCTPWTEKMLFRMGRMERYGLTRHFPDHFPKKLVWESIELLDLILLEGDLGDHHAWMRISTSKGFPVTTSYLTFRSVLLTATLIDSNLYYTPFTVFVFVPFNYLCRHFLTGVTSLLLKGPVWLQVFIPTKQELSELLLDFSTNLQPNWSFWTKKWTKLVTAAL